MSKLRRRRVGRLIEFRFTSVYPSLEAVQNRIAEIINSAEIFEAGKDHEAVNEAIDNLKWSQVYLTHSMAALRIWSRGMSNHSGRRSARKPQESEKD